jgi:hypothetical protein
MTHNPPSLNETLQSQYGPMLTIEMLANALHRPRGAFEQWINKSREPAATSMRQAKRKLGRRVYFVTAEVAAIITGDEVSK